MSMDDTAQAKQSLLMPNAFSGELSGEANKSWEDWLGHFEHGTGEWLEWQHMLAVVGGVTH